jgi:hypothetical protein
MVQSLCTVVGVGQSLWLAECAPDDICERCLFQMLKPRGIWHLERAVRCSQIVHIRHSRRLMIMVASSVLKQKHVPSQMNACSVTNWKAAVVNRQICGRHGM